MTDNDEWGVVFDIKRFAVHDGDGIRSTLFTKGCPLKCKWCHNPEGQSLDIELMWFETLCIGCGECIKSCPYDALTFEKSRVTIVREKCRKCGNCIDACPSLALKFDGWKMHYKDAFDELMKDKVFFQGSGGGVTISGGDPLVQSGFNLKVLALCKEAGVNTTIETCLYASRDVVMKFAEVVDNFIIDIKILDESNHTDAVGVSNRIILDNFEALTKTGANICVRIPLIPGYSDGDENITDIAKYVARVNKNAKVELLNYNPLAKSKYTSLQEEYLISSEAKPLSKEEMARKTKLVSDIMEISK